MGKLSPPDNLPGTNPPSLLGLDAQAIAEFWPLNSSTTHTSQTTL